MTLADELRAIADRLDAADAERSTALNELAGLASHRAGRASAAVADEADAEDAPTSVASRAPLEEGPAGAVGKGTPSVGTPAPTHRSSARSLLPEKDRAALQPTPPIPCPDGDRSFATPSALGVHRRHRHGHRAIPGARMACPDCGADVRVDRLTRHQRDSHPAPTVTNPVLHKGVEWFLCDRCPERYLTAQALEEHHAGHKPAPRGQPVGAQRPLVPETWP